MLNRRCCLQFSSYCDVNHSNWNSLRVQLVNEKVSDAILITEARHVLAKVSRPRIVTKLLGLKNINFV